MKRFFFLLLSLLTVLFVAPAQTKITSIKKVSDGLYVMYYDSTREKRDITKSTIVEFADHIALIEMPISNDGAGSVNLTDHTEGGEKVIQALKDYFPLKPLKYVLSSHWHPHSISSIIPFVSSGVTVVTTRNNFKRLSEFVDSTTFKKYRNYFQFVESDSMVFADNSNSIVAYKFNKSDYPNVPTEDFLYFYLPKYNVLHSSCMYQRLVGSHVKGKELISSRVDDLYKFLQTKNISPASVITTDTYFDESNGVASGDTLRSIVQNGISMTALQNDIYNIGENALVTKSDSIIKDFMANTIPISMVNGAVFKALRKRELSKALALARLQALANPSDPNSWDTFGEVYYILGEKTLAKRYEIQSTRIDKNFTYGGEKTWQKDLEDFQKMWGVQ